MINIPYQHSPDLSFVSESLNFEVGDRKAITEEDVQHWKRRRIRSAKSAESLLSLPITSRLGSPLTESLDPNKLMNMLSGNHNILSQFMGKETFGWYD